MDKPGKHDFRQMPHNFGIDDPKIIRSIFKRYKKRKVCVKYVKRKCVSFITFRKMMWQIKKKRAIIKRKKRAIKQRLNRGHLSHRQRK